MANFETVEVTTDILICGGGMAACGAAVEASYWAKKNGLKVTLWTRPPWTVPAQWPWAFRPSTSM